MDLFQINQVLKNEIGKDVDMIESFMQESLKAIYVTVLEYLQNVPQEEPEFLRAEAAEEQQPAAVRDSVAASIVVEERYQEGHDGDEDKQEPFEDAQKASKYAGLSPDKNASIHSATPEQFKRSRIAQNEQRSLTKMMEQAPSFVMSDSRYNDFPDITGYPAELQEQKQRQAMRHQNSVLNEVDKEESQMMESDYSHRANEQELLEENDQIQDLEEVFQDEFSTLRLKQLIISVLAEFKTQNPNLTLKDEELQHFK